jgi:hypothetical protein
MACRMGNRGTIYRPLDHLAVVYHARTIIMRSTASRPPVFSNPSSIAVYREAAFRDVPHTDRSNNAKWRSDG